ncbi:LysE family transporter, partial [Janthinobacterium sp. AD80]|uniref:LysE family transporter n=1 Tax=Janthinobacterium sp. AD80 TaxID=1528773 RepID=UPI0015E0DD1E
MTLSTASMPDAFSIFFQGMTLGLGLIVAIGSQNAFVLRQGLRREHVGSIVLFCALADAALIAAGVMGMSRALGQRPLLASALALGGAAFLAAFSMMPSRLSYCVSHLTAVFGPH